MILVLAALLACFVTAMAADGFMGVSEGAYYEEAATYVLEKAEIALSQ